MYAVIVKGKKYYVDVNDSDASIQKVEALSDSDLDIDDLPDFDDEAEITDTQHVVTAVLPCTITKVLAREGSKIGKDDVVLVCEAMKMEMEIRAGAAGVVSRILVKAGDHVEKGQRLALIEAE